jgi:hypothetical protein
MALPVMNFHFTGHRRYYFGTKFKEAEFMQ